MEKFANKCTPGLFDRALCLVKNDEKQQLSKKRHEILRLRVVALLHQLSYFRNQKNNPLQQDCGLHLSFHGASDDALTAGSLLGFSTHPRSVLNHKKGLSGKSIHKTQAIVESAIKNNNFLLLIIDDFHCVQSIKDPKQSQLSKCLHMCTGVVDHQESIPAMPTTRNVHRVVPVRIAGGAIVNCRGGIDANKVNELFQEHLSNYFTFSYLDSLPADFSQFDLTNVNKSLVELRVFTDEARHDLDLLSNTWLVDEFEQSLKSMANYRQAMQHLNEVCPSLSEYMEKNLLLLAGDWPTWYYNKKIICQWKPDVDPDRVLSVVPWQGPFHICLNSQEDVVANFRCFFEKLYKHLFSQRKVLPSKPKPHRISTLITTAFGGWLTVKTAVLPAFGQCKDPEYVLLVFLLDELVPLVFYFYSVIFRGGDQRKWVDAMIRLALMFIIQRRRHYDKAILCQLSDLVHQQEAIPNFQELLEQWLNELTEKEVEVFHSLLRRSVPPNATASQVQAAAKAISANRCAEDFCTWFLTNNPRGKGVRNLRDLSNKAAEFLLDFFISVRQNLGNSAKIPRGHRKYQPHYLPSLDATVDQRSLPLGYAWKGQEPDPLLACDAADCRADDNLLVAVQRFNCGHTFHKSCLGSSSNCNDHNYSILYGVKCPICSEQLPLRIQELADSFNKGLLAGNDETDGSNDNHDDDDDDDGSDNSDDDDSDDDGGKPDTLANKILIKAKQSLLHLPQSALFKYSNKNSKNVNSTDSNGKAVIVNTSMVCVTCGRVCKSKGGLTQHQNTHKGVNS
ncbi:hypothetical protein ABFA07_021324 [Porites harrisoni]